jgi:hypothetical protein
MRLQPAVAGVSMARRDGDRRVALEQEEKMCWSKNTTMSFVMDLVPSTSSWGDD